jgi:hypothetical protein
VMLRLRHLPYAGVMQPRPQQLVRNLVRGNGPHVPTPPVAPTTSTLCRCCYIIIMYVFLTRATKHQGKVAVA